MKKTVAVLFARSDSVYKSLPGCDVWDFQRDAMNFNGPGPVVCHPPCRGWGKLKGMAKPRVGELMTGLFSVDKVREFGGVLEHPANSGLFDAAGLPRPGRRDSFGGWTLPVYQLWWGHRAIKSTWLYIVGCEPREVPAIPFSLDTPKTTVENMSQAEREKTPPALAQWLVDLAARCSR